MRNALKFLKEVCSIFDTVIKNNINFEQFNEDTLNQSCNQTKVADFLKYVFPTHFKLSSYQR